MKNRITERLTEQEIHALVLYRDASLLIINKPSGIAVHNAGGSNHNLEQYFSWLCFDEPTQPVLTHRLDLGTSGCLVLARNLDSAQRMQALFSEQQIQKTYVADVRGVIVDDAGHITMPMAKQSPEKKHWWMKTDANGMPAHTEFRVLSRRENTTRVLLTPHTGRTHQLRVHCAHLGHPIIGDYIYGDDRESESEYLLHLHAWTIAIPLTPLVEVTAPLPAHMMLVEDLAS